MVLWMTLTLAYFVFTDHYDGQWAREYGLASQLGYWLDHVGDFLFYGVIVLTLFKGSREESSWGGARRKGSKPPVTSTPPSSTDAPAPPPRS